MEESSCCSNCEYYYSNFGGSVCNALHALPDKKNQAFGCVDFERKDIEKQFASDAELLQQVRQEKSKVFELVDLLDRHSEWLSERIQEILTVRESSHPPDSIEFVSYAAMLKG